MEPFRRHGLAVPQRHPLPALAGGGAMRSGACSTAMMGPRPPRLARVGSRP